MTDAAPPVGRLAPSPTGRLHVGHARSFLLAWWSIRSRGGRLWLRMEDLDASRVRPGMEEGVLEDLEWLGLDWDGEAVRQSERLDLYRAAVAELEARGLVYPCVCSRREIRLAQSAPHADDGARPYPGTCRGRFASREQAEADTGRSAALRFRVPEGPIEIHDTFAPPATFDVAAEAGDFPIWTRDDIPAYQLAVVVDDAAQGVTEVLRGDDLLASAARQWLLQDALGLPHPTWIHVPLVTDTEGRRLASRSSDLSLAELREQGVDPRALVAWAARSAGLEAPPRATPAEILAEYDLARVPREPVAITPDLPEELRDRRA